MSQRSAVQDHHKKSFSSTAPGDVNQGFEGLPFSWTVLNITSLQRTTWNPKTTSGCIREMVETSDQFSGSMGSLTGGSELRPPRPRRGVSSPGIGAQRIRLRVRGRPCSSEAGRTLSWNGPIPGFGLGEWCLLVISCGKIFEREVSKELNTCD